LELQYDEALGTFRLLLPLPNSLLLTRIIISLPINSFGSKWDLTFTAQRYNAIPKHSQLEKYKLEGSDPGPEELVVNMTLVV
jgi:hypothetical protein